MNTPVWNECGWKFTIQRLPAGSSIKQSTKERQGMFGRDPRAGNRKLKNAERKAYNFTCKNAIDKFQDAGNISGNHGQTLQ